jgi:hypothetical protein
MLMPALDAGAVEKDTVAEFATIALTASPVITVSVGVVASGPEPPELPPQPQSSTHSHTGPVLVGFRGIVLFRRVVSTWNEYTMPEELTALSFF